MPESATITAKLQPEDLRERWTEISSRQPGRLASDIAAELGVSEAELLASRVGHGATRLAPRWNELLNALGSLDRVKTVTRNTHAVIEKDGVYPAFQSFQVHSMFVCDDIDLRITLGCWAFAFAYTAPGAARGSVSRSIQFFGPAGQAVHKLFLKKESSLEQYHRVVGAFLHDDQRDSIEVSLPKAKAPNTRGIDRAAFLDEWSELKDTHHFFGLLQKYKLSRPRAMELAEGRFTRRVATIAPRILINQVSQMALRVMVVVGNGGCIQIHKGPLNKIVDWQGWLNVMNPGVEIHLKEDGIAQAWVVEKPTSDGRIYSLELFDAQGNDIASIFGVRKEAKAHETAWKILLSALPGIKEVA